jgi:DNA-binding transcriptional LysR family regulator
MAHLLIVYAYEMDERRLGVFAAVARCLSFSEAARSLHLSQPAVSQQVATLEAELGAKLFERSTRRVRLTAAGSALLARSESLLREYADVRRTIAAAEGRIAGDLQIAASLTIGAYVLPPVLAELARRHPEVRTRVTIQNTEEVVAALRAGRADLGFVEGERVEDPAIAFRMLREDELVVIAPVGHRFEALESVPLAELVNEPFVLREPGSGTRQVAESYLRGAGVDVGSLRVVAELSGIDAIKAAVAAGLGVSLISKSALPAGQRGNLVDRRIEGIRLVREMSAARLARSPMLPAASLLVELVAAASVPEVWGQPS